MRLFHGDRTNLNPVDQCRQPARLISNVWLVEISSDLGHCGGDVAEEDIDPLTGEMRTFLSELRR